MYNAANIHEKEKSFIYVDKKSVKTIKIHDIHTDDIYELSVFVLMKY